MWKLYVLTETIFFRLLPEPSASSLSRLSNTSRRQYLMTCSKESMSKFPSGGCFDAAACDSFQTINGKAVI